MSLVRWKPRSDSFMDPFFDRFVQQVNDMFCEWPVETASRPWYPALDLVEEKDRIIVRLELPGIDPKNVEINLQGNLLTVAGERKDDSERAEGKVLKREQTYGAFQRTLQLPFRVQSEKVTATYEKGIMTISLPKVEEQVGRQIQVEVK